MPQEQPLSAIGLSQTSKLDLIISSLYSIFLVAYVIYDYQAGMDKTAYNFYNSRKIEENSKDPVYSEITGMTHLYTKRPFIANQKFSRCFHYDESIDAKKKYEVCTDSLGRQFRFIAKIKFFFTH